MIKLYPQTEITTLGMIWPIMSSANERQPRTNHTKKYWLQNIVGREGGGEGGPGLKSNTMYVHVEFVRREAG